MKAIDRIMQHKWFQVFLFLFVWVSIFILYYPAHDAMLIDDGISGIYEMKIGGWKGFLHSYHFDNFYYGHYLFIGICYALFGVNTLGWFIVFTFFHALNTTLAFVFFRKLFTYLVSIESAAVISFSGSLLFAFSAYQSENIVWAATSHYMITLSILLMSLSWLCDFIGGKKTSFSLLIFHLFFLYALVTLEISILFPILYVLLFVLFLFYQKNQISFSTFGTKILTPIISLVFLYCLAHKFLHHTWLPQERQMQGMDIPLSQMVATLSQHVLKLFGFVHFLSYHTRDKIYELCLHWKKVGIVFELLFIAVSVFIYKKDKQKLFIFWFLLACSVLLYLPFIRCYFMYLMRLENDRYSYFASVFLLPLFAYFVFQLPKWIRYILLLAYVSASIYFLLPGIQARANSAKLYTTYLHTFPDTLKHKVYVMNVPAVCTDAYLFRAKPRFEISYEVLFDKKLACELEQLVWYNAMSEKDSFAVKKINDTAYHFQLKTNGSWLMHENIGATDYETADYKVDIDDWGGYNLIFKKPLAKDESIIYFTGKGFQKVNE
jgi:hypothetical protein